MITKETARRIYNCYQQIEEIDRIKKEMIEEVEKARKREAESHEPLSNNSFGRFGKGMQLGIPNGITSSMRVFDISPSIGLKVMDEQREKLEKDLRELETIARLELSCKSEDLDVKV